MIFPLDIFVIGLTGLRSEYFSLIYILYHWFIGISLSTVYIFIFVFSSVLYSFLVVVMDIFQLCTVFHITVLFIFSCSRVPYRLLLDISLSRLRQQSAVFTLRQIRQHSWAFQVFRCRFNSVFHIDRIDLDDSDMYMIFDGLMFRHLLP